MSNKPWIQAAIDVEDIDLAKDSARSGADWITFGWVLRNPDPAVCTEWIDAIHGALDEMRG